jgi:DNA-binding transcriptional LysR family regulator
LAIATVECLQLDLEDLRTFIAVTDAGGLSPAARRLGVSKSIVSRCIFRLEEALGVQLLTRTTRGACLTESGLTFKEHAGRVCSEMDLARELILPAGELCGRLRIAAPLSLGSTHFAPLFAELARKHPRLQVQASYGDRFVDVVAEGFDCAVRVGHLPDSNLVARRVASMHAKLVASPDYIRRHGIPETPDELVTHEALLQGTETWRLMDGPRVITVRPQGRFKADTAVALAAAVVAGLGIAKLPDFLAETYPPEALTPVMTRFPVAPCGVYVVRAQGQHLARKVRALTDILVQHLGVAFHIPRRAGSDQATSRVSEPVAESIVSNS